MEQMTRLDSALSVCCFGRPSDEFLQTSRVVLRNVENLLVARALASRSSTPYPLSQDLELAAKPFFEAEGFRHHEKFLAKASADAFEYDFWHPRMGAAVEVMGYRADDEIYKDLFKFHVHAGTRHAMIWVPRWKWVSGRRQDVNYSAAMKALRFVDGALNVDSVLVVPYDWKAISGSNWSLVAPVDLEA